MAPFYECHNCCDAFKGELLRENPIREIYYKRGSTKRERVRWRRGGRKKQITAFSPKERDKGRRDGASDI